MKARWISLGVAIGLGLALTLGFAFGADHPGWGVGPAVGKAAVTDTNNTDWRAAMDAMHDSPQMRALHVQMPAEWQQCDAMHDRMQQWTDPGQAGPGMMGPGGPGQSGGMMGSGYGPGSGGMMGSGYGGMMGS